jgi:hypothetical protein
VRLSHACVSPHLTWGADALTPAAKPAASPEYFRRQTVQPLKSLFDQGPADIEVSPNLAYGRAALGIALRFSGAADGGEAPSTQSGRHF